MTHELHVGPSFKLAAIPKLGQDFRWRKLDDGRCSVVLSGHLIHIRQDGQVLKYTSDSGCNLNRLLSSYFRLSDPIDKIYESISACDDQIAKLVDRYHPGLRLLRQDPWECTVAYICSPQGIPWIERNLEDIARELGYPIELEGKVHFTFPSPENVWRFGPRAFERLQFRYPDIPKYIISAAERICTHALDLAGLKCLSYTEATWQLMNKRSASRKPANGIGPKVADCIALFALNKMEAFPVDRNIARALVALYDDCPPLPDNFQGSLSDKQYKDIANWARKRFGKYACYVNQLLFHKQRPQRSPSGC